MEYKKSLRGTSMSTKGIRLKAKVLLTLLPYLKPFNVTLIEPLDKIFKIGKILVTVYLLALCLKKVKLSKQIVFIICFCFSWLTTILVINKLGVQDIINNILSIIGLTMFYMAFRQKKNIFDYLIVFLRYISIIYILLYTITVITKKPLFVGTAVSYENTFLGSDNYSAFILIVLATIILTYDIYKYNKVKVLSYIIVGMGFADLLYQFSVTGFVSYFILITLFVIRQHKNLIKCITPKGVILLSIVIVFLIGYMDLSSIFSKTLTDLQKVGFNGRDYLWPDTVTAIMRKPLMGYGYVTDRLQRTWILNGANHAHNIVLEYLFSTGLIGSSFFILYLQNLFKGINYRDPVIKSLQFGLIAYLMCSIFDFYIGLIYFYLLLMMFGFARERAGCNQSVAFSHKGQKKC